MHYPRVLGWINVSRRCHPKPGSIPKIVPPEGFFQHTSDRWLTNEALQLRRRYLKFNIDALKAAAVSAVDGAKSVTKMTKFHETDFSKIFSLTLDNGQKVMARLPTPMAGPARIVTESQVATAEFARQRLGIPVPQTLVWCADRDQTDVGAEFIIEEAPSGIQFFPDRGPTLSLAEKLGLTRELWKIEKKMLDNPLPAYGSIFFREDAESFGNSVDIDEMFSVGPSLRTSFWADDRATMNIDRGPWTDPYEYLFAICDREGQWINKYGRLQLSDPKFHQFVFLHEPDFFLDTLARFSQVIPFIVPKSDGLIQSTLSHPMGLDEPNIWISETALAAGRIEITAITDWQHSVATPLYLTGGLPCLINIGIAPGEWKWRWNIADTDFDEKKRATDVMEDHVQKCVAEYYKLAKQEAPNYFEAETDDELKLYADLVHSAATAWGDRLHLLLANLYQLQQMWPHSPFPCPYYMRDEDEDKIREAAHGWSCIQNFYREIGVLESAGWTHPEMYNDACEWYRSYREALLKDRGEVDNMPFSDLVAGGEQKVEEQEAPLNDQ